MVGSGPVGSETLTLQMPAGSLGSVGFLIIVLQTCSEVASPSEGLKLGSLNQAWNFKQGFGSRKGQDVPS